MSITGKIKTLFADSAKTEALFPRTKTSAVSDDNNIGLNVLLNNKQEKHTTKSCTLTTGGWSDLSQTINVTGVTANNTIIVTPSPSSYAVYGESGVYCSAQADGKLTFMCANDPTTNLIVNVLILD